MTFTVKDWQDAPSTATPLSAAALEDMETRLSAYADVAGGSALLGLDPTLPTYGADKTGAVDCTTALRNATTAALAGNLPVIFPPGTYKVSGRIHSASATANPVKYIAAVPGTVTIQRTASVPIIDVIGSRGTPVALTANVGMGALSCTTATLPSGLAVGDYVQLRSLLILMGVAVTAEVLRVSAITGSGPYTIGFVGRTEEAYATADSAVIEKLNFVAGSTLRGITFRQTAVNRDDANDALVQFTLTNGDVVERCTARDADCPGFEPVACINSVYRDIVVEQLTDDLANNRIGYGINVGGACRDITIYNLQGKYNRHAFTTNATAGGTDGCPRHITLVAPHVSESSNSALDTHAEGKFITFIAPQVHHQGDVGGAGAHGISVRAQNVTILEPTIVGSGASPGNSILVQAGGKQCRVVGGTLIQSVNSSVIQVLDADCTIDGTKITTVGSGYSASPIVVQAQRCTLRDLKVHQGDNTATTIIYFAGSNHILDGGQLDANGDRTIVNLPSGSTLTIMQPPSRFPNGSSVAAYAGTGLSGITHWEERYQALATDAAFTLTPVASPKATKHTGTLTANRAVTLATAGATPGMVFEIARTGGGAFTLDVNSTPAKSLATNTWGRFRYDGTAWYLSGYGAL